LSNVAHCFLFSKRIFKVITDFGQLKLAFLLLFLLYSNYQFVHAANDTRANAKSKFIASSVSDKYVIENRLVKKEYQIVDSAIETANCGIALDTYYIDRLMHESDKVSLIFEQNFNQL
jgi:hypothetical protein